MIRVCMHRSLNLTVCLHEAVIEVKVVFGLLRFHGLVEHVGSGRLLCVSGQ